MIKLIIFDLDGVMVDSKDMHYRALNLALESIDPKYVISRDEHLSTYDGMSTTSKLKLLTKNKDLPASLHDNVWKLKQYYTYKTINEEYTYDERIRQILKRLKDEGYTLYVASNAIYNTVKTILLRKGFLEYIDRFVSNEDVRCTKPSPEIYFHCMIQAGTNVHNTMILEDSHIGREAAMNSGAHVLPIANPANLTLQKIQDALCKIKPVNTAQKWLGHCNVVIPMAGNGSRFANAGYTFPKPLIDVHGKPMIQLVVDNLGLDPKCCTFIFIVRTEHMQQYNLYHLLNLIAPGCVIVETNGVTEGAACSILLAKEYINNNDPLVLANSDQYMEWNPNQFMYTMTSDEIDGGIVTFTNSHPKWSYAKLGEDGFVSEVAEKKPISDNATTGIYYFKHGSYFVKYAELMIEKNIRVNNEFYTCPVFNQVIEDGKKVKIFPIEKMYGLGVPEDLNYYLDTHK